MLAGVDGGYVNGVDADSGTAEDVEADDECAAAVGFFADVSAQPFEAAAHYFDFGAFRESGVDDAYGGVGVAEHEFHHFHLMVGDGDHRTVLPGSEPTGGVCHETFDVGEVDNLAAHALRAVYEYFGGDEYAVYLHFASGGALAQFLL